MGFGFKTDKEETAGGVVEVIQAQGEEWYAVGALKEVALAQKTWGDQGAAASELSTEGWASPR